MAEGYRFISRPAIPHLHGWVLPLIFERLESPQLAICSTICREWQSVISGDSEFWKRAYLKEKQSSIASEVWHPFPCDAEPPSTSETTEDCNLSESIRQAVYWKRAAAASFTWRRFHSGPIMLIGLKVSHHRLVACRVKGHTTAILSAQGAVRLWDLKSITCIFSVETGSTCFDGDIEFDSAMVVASCGEKHIKVYSRHSQQVTRSIEVNRSPSSKSIRLHNSTLHVACLDGTVKVYDLYSGSCSQIIRLCDSSYRVTCIHVDAERSLLLAGLSNGHVALYNLEECTVITECYRRMRRGALFPLINTLEQTCGFAFWHGANFEMFPRVFKSLGSTLSSPLAARTLSTACCELRFQLNDVVDWTSLAMRKYFPKANYRAASASRFKSVLHLTQKGGAVVVFLPEPGVRCVSRFVKNGSDLSMFEYADPGLGASSIDSNATMWTRTPSSALLGIHGLVNEEEEEVTCADGSGPRVVTTHGDGTLKLWEWGFPK